MDNEDIKIEEHDIETDSFYYQIKISECDIGKELTRRNMLSGKNFNECWYSKENSD